MEESKTALPTVDSKTSPDVESKNKLYVAHTWFMGDMKPLNDWLHNKPWIVRLPNWIFRGIGAPIFLNNPISGIIVLVAMFVGSPWIAINGLLGLFSAIATACLTKQDRSAIENGGATFHGMLVGIVIAASVDKNNWWPWVIFPTVVLAIISVYVASGLGSIFKAWKLPAFNLPFVITAYLFLAAYGNSNQVHFPIRSGAVNSTFVASELDWGKVFLAIPVCVAQIYGSTNIISGALILVAMLIYSPILLAHAVAGALWSLFTAIALAAPPALIYSGVYSFNAVLTCIALGGFFWVISIQVHILSIMSAIFSTLVMGAMLNTMTTNPLAFPFVISASIFLAVTSESKHFRRVPMDCLSYPERHRWVFKGNAVHNTSNGVSMDTMTVSTS